MKGSRIGADGALVPEEVYQKAPNKLLVVTRYPENPMRKGFDGTKGWVGDSKGEGLISVQDAADVERDADFYKDVELGRLYSQMKIAGRKKVGDRQSFVIAAKSRTGDTEMLYFDEQTGLLIRRYTEFKIALGSFPSQTDYEDYKEVDGVKVPFTIRWSVPGRTWGRKITEVKHNIRIDDTDFSQRRP